MADFTHGTWLGKRRLHEQADICYVSPSNWLADKAFESGLLPDKPLVIQNGVDQSIFRPREKSECRRQLELPHGRLIIVVSSSSLHDSNKGLLGVLPVIESLRAVDPFLLFVGRADEELRDLLEGLDHHFTGYIGDRERLASVFCAGDLLLYCVKQDNLPLTVMEAMSCGLPVFGYAVGGIPELLIDGVHGGLVSYGNNDELVGSIMHALREDGLGLMAEASAQYAHGRFGIERMADEYAGLYRRLIQERA